MLRGKGWNLLGEMRVLKGVARRHTHALHCFLDKHSLGKRVKMRIWSSPHHIRTLKSLSSSQERSIVKHILCHWVQSPIISFSRSSRCSWDFYKAVIEREVVADGVLPGREPLLVVRKPGANKLADSMECEALSWSLDDRHGDHGYIGVGGLHVISAVTMTFLHVIFFSITFIHVC